MLNYKEIIEKIKDILSTELKDKTILDKDVAQALDIEYNRFRQQKHRDIYIPYFNIMQFLAKRKISINYFFFNQLPETLVDSTSQYIILKYNKINASAGAGTFNYHFNLENIIIDKNIIEYLNINYKYTQIYQSFGDSMYPTIFENSLLFVDTSNITLNQKDIFIIETIDGLFIKKIKLIDSKFFLSSINQEYQDMEVQEFKIIGKVAGILSKI